MSDSTDARLALVAKRVAYLDALADAPLHKPALVEAVGDSRSTVDRAVRRLLDAGLVERTDAGFRTTFAGLLAADRYREYVADGTTVLEAADFLASLPRDCDLPVAALRSGEVREYAERAEAVADLLAPLRSATRYVAYLPALDDSRHLRLVHARVREAGMAADLLCTPAVLSRLETEFPRLAADLAAADNTTIRRVPEDRGYTLALAAGERDRLTLHPTGATDLLAADPGPAVEWARATLADLRGAATDVTADLTALADGLDTTPLGSHERRGAVDPADLGFDRIDAGVLTARAPTDPATAWRVGFTVADADRGYPFARRARDPGDPLDATEGGDPLPGVLLDALGAGGNRVLLGPPGTGRRTLCRQVAARWVRADNGPVFHRAAPADAPFDRVGPLVAALSNVDGHALVVVEDAGDEGTATRLAALLDRTRDDASVSVLAAAPADAWPPATTDPAAADRLRTALDTVELGPLSLVECRDAVAAFAAATGRDVPVSGDDLFERVREGDGPGDCHLLGYLLAAYTAGEPWSDAAAEPTGLDADARAALALVAPDGPDDDTLPLAVGLLAATLAAARLPVTPDALHAVAAAEHTGEPHRRTDAAIDALSGVLLFPGADGALRTQHPQWAVHFLDAALDDDERTAVAAFERALSALFAVADDPDRRERVASWLGRDAAGLDRVARDTDGVVTAVFDLLTRHASLAPLFGTSARSGVVLPEAASDTARLEVRGARVQGWYTAGNPANATTEAEELLAAVASADVDAATAAHAVVRARKRLADVADDRGDADAARDHLNAALDAARDGDRRSEVTVLNTLAMVELHADDYDAAARHLRAADERGADLGPTPERSATVYYLGRLHRKRGEYAAAEKRLRESLDIDRQQRPRNRIEEAATLNGLGTVATDRGDFDAAESYYRRALELHREANNCRGVAVALVNLGDLAVERDDPDAAEDRFREAIDAAEPLDEVTVHGAALGGLGSVALARGDFDDAERYQRERLAHTESDRGRATVAHRLGEIAAARGDEATAREQYTEAFEQFEALGAADRAVDAALALAETCSEPARAREWSDRAATLAADAGLDERVGEAAVLAERLPGG